MRYISMFSGMEDATVALHPLGWKAIRFAEIDKFPSAVLAHHYPNTPNVGNMTDHDWSQYRAVPCMKWIGERIEMVDQLETLK